MKVFSTTKLAIGLAAMMAVLSCSKNTPVEPKEVLPDVITAEVEQSTKVDIVNYTPVWKVNDEICVAGVKYKCTDAGVGTFEKVSGESDGTQSCCYPYSLYQGDGKFCLPYEYQQHSDIDFMPMIGSYDEATQKVTFKNLGAVCRFRIKNTHETQTVYAKSLIVTPSFADAATMTTNGMFTVSYPSQDDKTPQIVWFNDNSHQPFMVIRFDGVKTLAPGAYHDVYAFLPPYDYQDLNLRTEAYLNSECTGQVYFSSIDKGAASVERNNWYDIAVKANEWNPGVRGNGTTEAPFELGSATDITYINNQIKSSDNVVAKNYFAQATYVLTQDIAINKWTEPIACSIERPGVKAFNGTFDGQGHTIQIDDAEYPLFFDVDGGVIKNLIVKGYFVHMRSGDAVGTVTFSPFFYSAKNTYMVACVFNGTVVRFPFNPDPAISKPSIFGAMNNTCHLIGSAYMKQDDTPQYQGVMLAGDNTTISDVQGVEGYTDSNHDQAITNLNSTLQTWCNSSVPERAKTDYRYQWQDGKLVLTKANN